MLDDDSSDLTAPLLSSSVNEGTSEAAAVTVAIPMTLADLPSHEPLYAHVYNILVEALPTCPPVTLGELLLLYKLTFADVFADVWDESKPEYKSQIRALRDALVSSWRKLQRPGEDGDQKAPAAEAEPPPQTSSCSGQLHNGVTVVESYLIVEDLHSNALTPRQRDRLQQALTDKVYRSRLQSELSKFVSVFESIARFDREGDALQVGLSGFRSLFGLLDQFVEEEETEDGEEGAGASGAGGEKTLKNQDSDLMSGTSRVLTGAANHEERMLALYRKLDNNGNGLLDFPDFLTLVGGFEEDTPCIDMDSVLEAFAMLQSKFAVIDKDNDGSLDFRDLVETFENVGLGHLTKDEAVSARLFGHIKLQLTGDAVVSKKRPRSKGGVGGEGRAAGKAGLRGKIRRASAAAVHPLTGLGEDDADGEGCGELLMVRNDPRTMGFGAFLSYVPLNHDARNFFKQMHGVEPTLSSIRGLELDQEALWWADVVNQFPKVKRAVLETVAAGGENAAGPDHAAAEEAEKNLLRALEWVHRVG